MNWKLRSVKIEKETLCKALSLIHGRPYGGLGLAALIQLTLKFMDKKQKNLKMLK